MIRRWSFVLMVCTLIATFLIISLLSHGSGYTEKRSSVQWQYVTIGETEIRDRAKSNGNNEDENIWYYKPARMRSTMNAEEIEKIKKCQKTAHDDREQSWKLFLKDINVCVLHHSYLREKDTVVIEVGGNIGNDAFQMLSIYNHRHIILEPVASYADGLRERLKHYSRITVLNFGLGKQSETKYVKVNGDATSVFAKEPGHIPIHMINSTEFFIQIGVGVFSVDLLTMDCEGCELDVIENLLSTNLIIFVKNIQFESHGHLEGVNNQDWIERYCTIQEYLSRTHRLTFQYKHVWENWRRNDL